MRMPSDLPDQSARPPDLHEFLARAGSLSATEGVAVLRFDQHLRWQQGERVGAEVYLQALPAVAGNTEQAIELVYGEFLLREELGEVPTLDEYLERFPQYASRLRQQVELHQALASDSQVGATRVEPAPGATRKKGIESTAIPPTFPAVAGYEVLEVLGRGAMGVVYKARQAGLNRLVALKMILGGAYADADTLARFRLEAETVARLQHPNIVQVFEVGQHDGQPYCTLEYAEGGNLARKLGGVPQPARQAARLVEVLARAMHCAHQRGIVHRDLKPANVLLTADGEPKISDFGLAKRLDLDSNRTQSGDVLGTPNYMAPEQAAGRAKEVGPATDVYALGAMLYEMLTGRPPFLAKTWLEALQQIQNWPPIPPSRVQPRIPRDLETICLECLEKEPLRRYPSAESLANDLRAFLAGEPIQARPAGKAEQVLAWIRRRPTAAVLLGVGGATVAGLLVGAWWYSALGVGAATVVSLLVGAWWYNARLQTALRELEQQQVLAQRSVERLHLLLEATQRLMSVPDLDTLLRLITETTTRMANAERATIFLIDPNSRELWSRMALGNDVQVIRVPLGVGIAGTVAVTGETINIPDAYADKRFNRAIDQATGYQTRNLLAFPMTAADGRIFGVFEILNKRGGPFEAEDVGFLCSLASSAAVALENARRFPAEKSKND